MFIAEDGGAVFRGGEQGLSSARDHAGDEASLSNPSEDLSWLKGHSAKVESPRSLVLPPLKLPGLADVVVVDEAAACYDDGLRSPPSSKGKLSPPPIIRSTPNSLWQIVNHATEDIAPAVSSACSPVSAFPSAHSLLESEWSSGSGSTEMDYVPSERWNARLSDDLMDVDKPVPDDFSPPGLVYSTRRRLHLTVPYSVGNEFLERVHDMQRRNPHAPLVPSTFNPMRGEYPAQIWSVIPDMKKKRRFKTVYWVPMRFRYACAGDYWRFTPGQYVAGDFDHCPRCRKDDLRIRCLIRMGDRSAHREDKVFDRGGDGEDICVDDIEMDDDAIFMDISREYAFGRPLTLTFDDSYDGTGVPDSPRIKDLDDFGS